MVLLAAKQTFKISKLQNYMSHVNETWSSYVPPQHLPLAGKCGWHLRDEGGRSGGCIHKAIKKCHEIKIISTLTRPNNSLKKAMNLGVFLLSSLTISLYCWQGVRVEGGGLPPIRGVLLTSKSSLKWYFLLLSDLLKYQNIKTPELHVPCKWNLVQLCTTSTPFMSRKMRVTDNRGSWGVGGVWRVHTKSHEKMPWN